MLSELLIHNFAIIDTLKIRFNGGFNVLTGETGAGKSIILDAMSLVLGGRADTAMVRAGCDSAQVEAIFELDEGMQKRLEPLLMAEGLEGDSSDLLVIARELRANGRTVARLNGRSVNLTILRQLSAPLIDIHGQGEHLSLLKPKSHLPLLDVYAGLEKERTAVSQQVSRLQAIQRELNGLRQDERLLAQRMDILRFQTEEVEAANLQIGEEEDLREERNRLANAEQLTRYAAETLALLSGGGDLDADGGDESANAIDALSGAERAMGQLARYDDTQNQLLETIQGLTFQLNEIAADVGAYLDRIEFNPDRLNEVEERLELIGSLKRKYGDSIEAILQAQKKALQALETISNSEERIAALAIEEDKALRQAGKLMEALSKKRAKAAQTLAAAIEKELGDLRMAGTRFSVGFQVEEAPNGVYAQDKRLAYDQSGYDRAEFLLSPNPGEPLKPMAKVASGGETARLMLALKTALSRADATPTLIFDEIDQGIGGRVGDIVGQKLWGLTAANAHQVIVVTHLPQLAGYGDVHFHVSKQVHNGRTNTSITALEGVARVSELAEMLGAGGGHGRRAAESILRGATAVKRAA